MTDIQCVFESMTGKGSIFISNLAAAQDLTLLRSKTITAILSVARSGLLQHSRQDIPHYLYIPAQDIEEYPLFKHFNETYEFIEQARKQTNVLVHCMAGVSRSVTIVIAYLLKKYKYSLSQVISIIQRKRRKINPNKGFIQQLKQYAQQQGINCDFDDRNLHDARSKSNVKQTRGKSASKTREEKCNLLKFEPPSQSMYKNQTKQNQFQIIQLRCEVQWKQSNQIKLLSKTTTEYSLQQANKLILQKTSLSMAGRGELKKRPSIDLQKNKRRPSIEQKITKLREKLMHKDELQKKQIVQLRSTSSQQKSTPIKSNKQNKKKISNEQQTTDRSSNYKKLQDYISLYNKKHPNPTINTKRMSEYIICQRNTQCYTPQYQYCSTKRQQEMFSEQLKIDSTLYAKNNKLKKVNVRAME